MNDTEADKLIEAFANSTSVAIGGNVLVTYHKYGAGMKPRPPATGIKFEDTEYLSRIIHGAEQFLWYLRREGYVIKKGKSK